MPTRDKQLRQTGNRVQELLDAVQPPIVTTLPQGGFVPNIVYNLGPLTGTVTFALATPTDNTIVNHYYWMFDTGNTAPTITWPANIDWKGGAAPTIEANTHYEISILNGKGVAFDI